MDQFRKNGPPIGQVGRLIRNMSLQGMGGSIQSDSWFGATDVYETGEEIIVYMDVAGVSPEHLSVVVEEMAVTISGKREYPMPQAVSCIHQLEIDRGVFKRTISLPKPVDVDKASSEYQNGILIVTLPIRKSAGRVKIEVG